MFEMVNGKCYLSMLDYKIKSKNLLSIHLIIPTAPTEKISLNVPPSNSLSFLSLTSGGLAKRLMLTASAALIPKNRMM